MQLRRLTLPVAGIAALAAVALVATPARADDEYPTDPEQAMHTYESDVAHWAEGPVGWIMLDEEQDTWDELDSREAKRQFIDAFWERRDADRRDEANLVKAAFYSRVAAANDRYHGFPRGWKSDRGRVHIVLGAPDARRPAMGLGAEAVEWTYFTVGPRALGLRVEDSFGEFSVLFVQTNDRAGYRLYTETGLSASMPPVVRDALQWAKEAYVMNPEVSLTAASQHEKR